MGDYVRPAISVREFRDADGVVIPYGERWGMDGPPEHTYSVTSNLERFAPLHTVADALIAWLVDTYDVATEQVDPGSLLSPRDDIVRAVRLVPTAPDAAPLTFVLTAFPGVVVEAGFLYVDRLPTCGCDACDDSWEYLADELEWQVQAVVQGRLTEKLRGLLRRAVDFALEMPGVGGVSGGQRLLRKDERARASALARRVPRGGVWAPWPLREPQPEPQP